MSNWERAIAVVLRHEGGWVNNPRDRGGETNFGISTLIVIRDGITADELGVDPVRLARHLASHEAWWRLTKEERANPDNKPAEPEGLFKTMTVASAVGIYRRRFWERFKYDQLNDWRVATKVFDACVNMGAHKAHVLAQEAAGLAGHPVGVDGVLGPASIAAINACPVDDQGEHLPPGFLSQYSERLKSYYRLIVANDPSQSVFLSNWLLRAAWVG